MFGGNVVALHTAKNCQTRLEAITSALKVLENRWAFEHVFGKGGDWVHVDPVQLLESLEECTEENDGIEFYWSRL